MPHFKSVAHRWLNQREFPLKSEISSDFVYFQSEKNSDFRKK